MDDLQAVAAAQIARAAMRPATKPRFGWSQRGQTMVEFAFCAVVLLMLLFGIMDFGRALYAYHFVDNAAREATRYAIVRGASSPKPVSASDIQSFVSSMALGLNAHACSSSPTALCATTTWTPDNKPGSSVQVKVTYNFQPLVPFLPHAMLQLSSTSEMVISQ